METKNLLLPSLSNRKCVGLSLLNRVPEADLELKMYEIRRDYVKFKENTRYEEGKMWDELYNNHRELRKSYVSKYSREEVLHNKELFYLPRVPSYSVESPVLDPPAETPFAERYKQFVTFKADTMRRMRLRRSERRPNYADLYAREFNRKHKNSDNFHKVLAKFEEKRKQGHGALNILKEEAGGTTLKLATTSEGLSPTSEVKGSGQDGWSSLSLLGPPRYGQTEKEGAGTQRKRKLAVGHTNLAESQRFHTLNYFDAGLAQETSSRPPQLEKLATLVVAPKKV